MSAPTCVECRGLATHNKQVSKLVDARILERLIPIFGAEVGGRMDEEHIHSRIFLFVHYTNCR